MVERWRIPFGTEDDTRIPGEGLARVAVAPILQGPGGVRVEVERMSSDTHRDGNITTSLSLGLRALVEEILGSIAYLAPGQERNRCVTCDGRFSLSLTAVEGSAEVPSHPCTSAHVRDEESKWDDYAPSGHRERGGGGHQADEGADGDSHGKAPDGWLEGLWKSVNGTDLQIRFWKKTREREREVK